MRTDSHSQQFDDLHSAIDIMLKGLFKKIGRKAAQEDMDNFLAYVQSGTDSEIAMIRTKLLKTPNHTLPLTKSI